jgi:EAL domain-containing protein (putative c-di-GMP-specific phosphodiesterase class I)
VTIEGLHRMGVTLSIDDFGTGYSSMAYLKRFHVDTLKIDKSFVKDLGRDADDEAIVAAIIHMAKTLRCSTVAEGVETREQRDFLTAHGCDVAQGYHLHRPMDADAVRALLQPGERGHEPPRQPVLETT